MNLSFAGCGFMGIYHLGVASCFRTYAPHVLLNKISGTSAGSAVALSLLVESPLGDMASHILEGCYDARKGVLGPFSSYFDPNIWLRKGLEKNLAEDCHLKVSGRLHVSLTRVYDGQNILVSQFDTKEEVIQVVLASCFIPVFSGLLPPRYKGSRVIDGGFSNNLPILDKETITVSPFSGGADICPQTKDLENALWVSASNTSVELSRENFLRMFHIMIAPPPDLIARYCKQGFDDTLRFLQSRYLISCTRCLGVASSYQIEEELPHNTDTCVEFDPDCGECVKQRLEADAGTVPPSVVQVFDKYVDKFDPSYGQMIQENQILRMVCYPTMVAFHGFLWILTHFFPKISTFLAKFVDQVVLLVFGNQFDTSSNSHMAKYTCEFNITQYGEDSMTDLAKYSDQERRESVKDILNLELVAHLESITPPNLPGSQEAAKKFQKENLTAAVFSHSGVTSLVGSAVPSRLGSCAVSRMGSRVNSEDSLCELGGKLPGPIEQIKHVTDNQEAVMAFYYRDSSTELKMMEIFDVTQTDPSLLIKDQLDHSLDTSFLRSSLEASRARHSSAPSSLPRARHPSIGTIAPSTVISRVLNIEQGLVNPLVCVTPPSPKSDEDFKDCNGDDTLGLDTDNEYFSDPEDEQRMNAPGMAIA